MHVNEREHPLTKYANHTGGFIMKKNCTELVMILDRSGSMGGLESDTIGGFNAMMQQQRETEGEVLVSTVLFDHESVVLHDRVPLTDIKPMTTADYQVRGCTALLDAVGNAVRHIKNVHKYIREEDVPEKTIFVITTDGLENASREYTKKDVQKLIEEQKGKGWEFLFLGANIDAVEAAREIGIAKDRAVTYHSDHVGTQLNYKCAGRAVSRMRVCDAEPLAADWKEEIEEYAKQQKKGK